MESLKNNDPNDNEKFFEWWLVDFYACGLVYDYFYQPETFVLVERLPFYVKQVYKRKDPIIKTRTLFDNLVYTPDYKVWFNPKLYNRLFGIFNSLNRELEEDPTLEVGNVYLNTLFYGTEISYIETEEYGWVYEIWFDVKPPTEARNSGSLGSSRDFRYNSRLLYNRYGIYCNKVVPVANSNSLYHKTFFPDRYLMNDSNSGPRRKRSAGKGSDLKPIKDFDFYRPMHTYLESKGIVI